MKAQRIIAIVLAIVVLVGIAAGYKLYLQPQLNAFKASKLKLAKMEKKLEELHSKFCSAIPAELEKNWRGVIGPWDEALEARAIEFGEAEAFEIDVVPAGRLPKIYYGQRFDEIMQELYQEANEKRIYLPVNPVASFGVLETTLPSMTEEQVEISLLRLRLGCSMVRLLLDEEPIQIDRIEVWPERIEGPLDVQTVGYAFSMKLSGLVKFLNKLTERAQFSRIDHIRITNPNLLASSDPPLRVELLFTQGQFRDQVRSDFDVDSALAKLDKAAGGDQAELMKRLKDGRKTGGAFGRGGSGRRKPPTWWQRFRKNYLPF